MKSTKYFVLLSGLFITLCISSCKKDDDSSSNGSNNKIKRVEKEIEDGVTIRTFSYDTNGRCIKIDYADRTIKYEYTNGKVVSTIDFNNPSQTDIVQTYLLNSSGLASSCTYQSNGKSYVVDYEYNTDNLLMKKTTKHNTATNSKYITDNTFIYSYNSSGDCIKYVYQLEFTNVIYQYEYDESRMNTLSNKHHGLEWLGELSVHIPKTYIVTTGFYAPEWNSKTDFTYYNWTYDSAGYAIRNIQTGASSTIKTYTYN